MKLKATEIKPNPDNPRLIKDDKFKKLVESIREFPQMLELRPIVIDENNMVLGGNMRLKACLELGMKEVPVIYAKDLTPEQKEVVKAKLSAVKALNLNQDIEESWVQVI